MEENGEDEQLWAFRQAFEDALSLPADGFVIGEPVAVITFDYDGNERRGPHDVGGRVAPNTSS